MLKPLPNDTESGEVPPASHEREREFDDVIPVLLSQFQVTITTQLCYVDCALYSDCGPLHKSRARFKNLSHLMVSKLTVCL